jgi:hypothetical protein
MYAASNQTSAAANIVRSPAQRPIAPEPSAAGETPSATNQGITSGIGKLHAVSEHSIHTHHIASILSGSDQAVSAALGSISNGCWRELDVHLAAPAPIEPKLSEV